MKFQVSNDVQISQYAELSSSAEIAQFIVENGSADESDLLLRSEQLWGVPMSLIVDQISGRRKARLKIPTYYSNAGILYPPGLNLEQSSSEKTAVLKSGLLAGAVSHNPDTLADLTGGFGIDSWFFSKEFGAVNYVEPKGVLAWIARHNHDTLGAHGITHHVQTAEKFLAGNTFQFDAVYIDPSRRNGSGRVFRLSECEPDISKLQPLIFRFTDVILVKTSPLLDITAALRELSSVSVVYVVSVDQECRELLFLCKKGFLGEAKICTIHLFKELTETFDFYLSEEKRQESQLGPIQTYLYEPNPSLMKAGALRSLAKTFNAPKIHVNSHFLSSEALVDRFPGRIFQIVARVPTKGRDLSRILPDMRANVVVRNYPLSAEQLKKKLKLSDGGADYVIGTTSHSEGRVVLLARRIR